MPCLRVYLRLGYHGRVLPPARGRNHGRRTRTVIGSAGPREGRETEGVRRETRDGRGRRCGKEENVKTDRRRDSLQSPLEMSRRVRSRGVCERTGQPDLWRYDGGTDPLKEEGHLDEEGRTL